MHDESVRSTEVDTSTKLVAHIVLVRRRLPRLAWLARLHRAYGYRWTDWYQHDGLHDCGLVLSAQVHCRPTSQDDQQMH